MRFCTLSGATLLSYLRETGLITDETVFAADLRIRERLGRNACFVLESETRRLFVKQHRDGRRDPHSPLLREFECLQCLADIPIAPNVLQFDPHATTLVTEWLPPDSLAIGLYEKKSHTSDVRLSDWGAGLAHIHSTSPGKIGMAPIPFVLHSTTWEYSVRRAPAFIAVTGRMKNLRETCLAMGQNLKETALIHGDNKPDNVIFREDGSCCLIDFELGGRGDPYWDIAMGTAHLIGDGLTPLDQKEEIDITAVLSQAQTSVKAFLKGYADASHKGAQRGSFDVTWLGQLTGAALIGYAYANMLGVTHPTRSHLQLLQLGENTLKSPLAFMGNFL